MAVGDNNIDNCPVCIVDNRHCDMMRIGSLDGKTEHFYVMCTKCRFAGLTAETREGARHLWNKVQRISRQRT